MTFFFDWLKAWIKDVASTNLTIVTGLAEGLLYVLWAMAAATWWRPIDPDTLDTIGLFITAQITGGVVQFGVKRATDKTLQEAKATAAIAQQRATVSMKAVGGEP